MADILSEKERSRRMSLVKGRGNRSTEIRLVGILRQLGIRGWRRGSTLPGRPDFVFSHERVAIFVDGCFWHGCPEHYTVPVINAAFWRRKRRDNLVRDRRVDAELRRRGWRVIRIWEHEFRVRNLTSLIRRLRRKFRSQRTIGRGGPLDVNSATASCAPITHWQRAPRAERPALNAGNRSSPESASAKINF